MRLFIALLILLGLKTSGAQEVVPLRHKASSGNSLLSSVAAFFPLDEPTGNTTGATRVDSVGGLQWLDKNNNLYGIRGVAGGAACDGGNSAGNYLAVTNAIFDQGSGKSFTCTFWACCGNGGLIGEWTSSAANDYDWQAQVGGNANISVFCNDLSSNPHQTQTTNFNAAPGSSTRTFTFYAFGYDAAKQWWWASANAAPMNPVTSVNGVRATGGRGFVCIPHLAIVDEVGYWRCALTQQELTNLYNGGFADKYPFGITPGQNVADGFGWAVTNSGGTISTTTYNATKTLCNSLYNNGILGNFSAMMGMPNETLEGALETIVCPVYFQGDGRGIEPAVRPFKNFHSFVNGDVSINGVTGNGANKWSQINYLSAGTSDLVTNGICDSGFVIYPYTATSSASGIEFGAEDFFGSPTQFDLQFRINTTSFDGISRKTMGYWGYTNSIVFSASQTAGYYAIQRSANNSMTMYFANSGNPHAVVQTDTTTIGSCAISRSGTLPLWAYYDGNICGGCNFSVNTLSFFGIVWKHLATADSANAFSAIQTYRQAIGGGFQ